MLQTWYAAQMSTGLQPLAVTQDATVGPEFLPLFEEQRREAVWPDRPRYLLSYAYVAGWQLIGWLLDK
jgi:hypothetical protein